MTRRPPPIQVLPKATALRLSLVVFIAAACPIRGTAAGSQFSEKARKPSRKSAHLESVLTQLIEAPDAEAFARQRLIDLDQGRVRVIIELREDKQLDVGPNIAIESRYQNLVAAWVPVSELDSLAQREDVLFIRVPQKPVANHE